MPTTDPAAAAGGTLAEGAAAVIFHASLQGRSTGLRGGGAQSFFPVLVGLGRLRNPLRGCGGSVNDVALGIDEGRAGAAPAAAGALSRLAAPLMVARCRWAPPAADKAVRKSSHPRHPRGGWGCVTAVDALPSAVPVGALE